MNLFSLQIKFLFCLVSLIWLAHFSKAEVHSKGEVALETRVFENDGNPQSIDNAFALKARLEASYKHKISNKKLKEKLRLLGRVDRQDSERRHFIVEEAWVDIKGYPLRIRAGSQMLNWTATEAFHPADIINSRNLDSNIENQEKIGEPMISMTLKFEGGNLTAYYMPIYITPINTSPSSRLSIFDPGTQTDRLVRIGIDGEEDKDEFGHQWALKYSRTIDQTDFSLYGVEHLDRHQPTAVIDPSNLKVVPIYQYVVQFGTTVTHIVDSVILKMEYAHRIYPSPKNKTYFLQSIEKKDFSQLALGLEYGWSNKNFTETTLLIEAQTILGLRKTKRASTSFFQRDMLLGLRHAFNDDMGKELFFSIIFDIERSKEYLFNLSYSQRLSDTISIKTGARIIYAPSDTTTQRGLQLIDKSDQLFINLIRYF